MVVVAEAHAKRKKHENMELNASLAWSSDL
jgi:hypothetical protein